MKHDNLELEKLTIEILDSCYLMSLGTYDEGGPWVSDVVFVHDDQLNLYWLSDQKTRHSQAIQKNGKVAATVTASNNQGDSNVGLQISGHAEELTGVLENIVKAHLLKRKKSLDEFSEKLEQGKRWYKLTPNLIEIIYEPFWGFTKHKLEL